MRSVFRGSNPDSRFLRERRKPTPGWDAGQGVMACLWPVGYNGGMYTLELTPEFDAWLKSRTPMDRWGDPRELVGAAVFLASPASSFVSGQILYVDGGVLATL